MVLCLKQGIGYTPDTFVETASGQEPDRRPPAFFYDLVPQGRGRSYLLARLGQADSASLVMPLMMAGAFNPIGCPRFASAVAFFDEEARKHHDPGTADGFDLEDVLGHSEDFLDHLSLHAMLAAGSIGGLVAT